jgi:hypothetical protein
MKKNNKRIEGILLDIIGIIAILVIVISLLSIGSKFTGYVSYNMTESDVNISISDVVKINFTLDNINFGSGYVLPGKPFAIIDTTGIIQDGNWSSVSEGFKLENNGNTNVAIYLKTDHNSGSFIGGTNSTYLYNVTNLYPGSCIPGNINLSDWNPVNITGDGTMICSQLSQRINNNSIRIDVRLKIPNDASAGSKSDMFTATAIKV